jgi:hypothetical protein
MVGVRGIDVGDNGLRIDAFDAPVGGLLVGSNSVFGVSRFGHGEFYDLSVNFGSIRRVESTNSQTPTTTMELFWTISTSRLLPKPLCQPLFRALRPFLELVG